MNQSSYLFVPSKQAILGLLVKNVGEGKFTQGEFQDLTPEQDDQQDFGFEEEEAPDNSQRQLFRKSIALGPQKKPTVNHNPPSLRINKYSFVYGSNPAPYSITLIEGKICRGIGVNIFLEGHIYTGHNYEVNYMNYDVNRGILISGTQGKSPEVRLWKVIKNENNIKLQLNDPCKFNLPMSSTGVGFAWFSSDDLLAVITRYTLHRSSQLFTFDLQSGKRRVCQVKLGKVLNMVISSPALILNQEGIKKLNILSKTQATSSLIDEGCEASTCQVTIQKDLLIVGSLNGSIKVTHLSNNSTLKSDSSHSKAVICIRSLGNNHFISSGNDKKLILHRIDLQITKIYKISQIQVPSTCITIMPKSTSLMCLLKSTDILQVSLSESSLKLATNPLSTGIVYSPQPGPKTTPHIIFNKYNKKYLYSLSDTPQVCVLGFDDHSQLISAKKTHLRYAPSQLDIHGTTVAYVYQQDLETYKSAFKTQMKSAIKKTQYKNGILVMEDYTSNKIVAQLKLSSNAYCTKIKFNSEGDKLAVGFSTGLISVYALEKFSNITPIAQSSIHTSDITDLLWSTNSKILKSISNSNLVYLNLISNNQTMAPIYTSKGIRECQWLSCGKYDWKTYFLWDAHRNLPEDITQVKETSDYLLACMTNGALKIYRNPAGKEGQQLIRLFNRPYTCEIIKQDDLRFQGIFAANGIIFGLEIGQDFYDDDQNSSFEDVSQL